MLEILNFSIRIVMWDQIIYNCKLSFFPSKFVQFSLHLKTRKLTPRTFTPTQIDLKEFGQHTEIKI